MYKLLYFVGCQIKLFRVHKLQFMKCFHLLAGVPWNYMHMQVENVLVCCPLVLLDYADSFSFHRLLNGYGNLFGGFMYFS